MTEKIVCMVLGAIFTLSSPVPAQDSLPCPGDEEVDACIAVDEVNFTVDGKDRGTMTVHRRVHVFNERGTTYGHFAVAETEFQDCEEIEGSIIDLSGEVLQELEDDDIVRRSYERSDVLHDDVFVSSCRLEHNNFPYIVDYRYRLEVENLYMWPGWYPRHDIPVLRATLRLDAPKDMKYQVHTIGIDVEPNVTEDRNRVHLIWKLENLEPAVVEPLMPPEDRVQTAILFAPLVFELGGEKGSFATWKLFGDWYARLLGGRTSLSKSVAEKAVRSVSVSEEEDRAGRVRALYRHLQNSTRYVAIEYGIGSIQPTPANLVFEHRYGDCKDLSAYMVGLLGAFGIEAHIALVRTRDRGVVRKEFPSDQFNHVIALVPLENDTLWLECTSDLLTADDLPHSVEGCDILVISEDSCAFVRTPESLCEENVWSSRLDVKLDGKGRGVLSGSVEAVGNEATGLRFSLSDLDTDGRLRWLTGRIGRRIPGFELESFELACLRENLHLPLSVLFAGTATRFSTVTGRRLFINPNLLHRRTGKDVLKDPERTFPLHFPYARTERDVVVLDLPDGFELEHAPEPVQIENDFASYSTTHALSDSVLTYCRTYTLKKRQIPASFYDEYVNFMRSVVSCDRAKFVFVRAE